MAAAGGTESQPSSSSTTKLSLKTCNSDSILSPCNPSLQRDHQGHPQQPLISDSTHPRGNHPHLSSRELLIGSLSQEQHPITINELQQRRDANQPDGDRRVSVISRGDRDEGSELKSYQNRIGEFAALYYRFCLNWNLAGRLEKEKWRRRRERISKMRRVDLPKALLGSIRFHSIKVGFWTWSSNPVLI